MAASGGSTVLLQNKQPIIRNPELLTIPGAQPNPPIMPLPVRNQLHAFKQPKKGHPETTTIHNNTSIIIITCKCLIITC